MAKLNPIEWKIFVNYDVNYDEEYNSHDVLSHKERDAKEKEEI
jgi:hypothetical protein